MGSPVLYKGSLALVQVERYARLQVGFVGVRGLLERLLVQLHLFVLFCWPQLEKIYSLSKRNNRWTYPLTPPPGSRLLLPILTVYSYIFGPGKTSRLVRPEKGAALLNWDS